MEFHDSSPAATVVRQFFAAANSSDVEAVRPYIADDIVVHTSIPGIAPGRDGFETFMGVYFGAFPVQRTEVDQVVGDGDRVAVLHTHHLTHGGEFAGLPPTGKQVMIEGLELFRVADGRIVEMWHHDDLLSLLQQLGAIPAPGSA